LCLIYGQSQSITWGVVKRILRYLKHSNTWGIFYSTNAKQEFPQGWTNADWARNLASRKSTSRNVFLFGRGSISWQSRKQATIALSSIESEYISVASVAKEAMCLHQSFNDLGFP